MHIVRVLFSGEEKKKKNFIIVIQPDMYMSGYDVDFDQSFFSYLD